MFNVGIVLKGHETRDYFFCDFSGGVWSGDPVLVVGDV